jgi:hypothetical protein
VGQKDSLVSGRPLQHSRIVRPGESHVLDTDQVDAGVPQTDALKDVVVEVLVREQTDHAESCPAWRAIRRARVPVGSKSRSFACLTSAERLR